MDSLRNAYDKVEKAFAPPDHLDEDISKLSLASGRSVWRELQRTVRERSLNENLDPHAYKDRLSEAHDFLRDFSLEFFGTHRRLVIS